MTEPSEKKIGLGLLAGISTGVFWGIPFLVPQMIPTYTPLEIAFGRFFFFGLISLFFLKEVVRIIRSLSVKDRIRIFFLSASGFWFYSILLFWGIQQTDGILSSLILGLLPVLIPLCTPDRKSGGPRFYIGLLCLWAGLLNLIAFPVLNGIVRLKTPSLGGILALLAALGLWTWFAISNSQFLKRNAALDRRDFASVVGVVSLLCMIPIFLIRVNPHELMHRPEVNVYLLGSFALGAGSSWLANWLWNICSYHCPSEISGPLIVGETVFGLTYSFIFESRLPRSYETFSIVLFMLGVFLAVTAQWKAHHATQEQT